MDTLTALLEESARRYPDNTATVIRAGIRTARLSYAQLEQRAHAFATLVRDRQVGPGDRVVIWAANQPDWVAAMFGTFLAGAVVVPLDVRSSRDFVERVVGLTGPKLAFAGRTEAEILRAMEVPSLEFGTFDVPVNGRVTPAPIGPDTLAEIIFTSGTTGDPKGVMLTHGNIASNVTAGLQAIHLTAETRLLSLLPLSHMFEQTGGCFAPIAVGAAVAYPTSRQPSALARTMQDWKPTVMIMVPQALQLLMSAVEREAANTGRTKLLERLRRIAGRLPRQGRRRLFGSVLKRFGGELDFMASGGAPLDPALQAKWEAMGVDIVEGYGTTECAPIVSINPRQDRRRRSVGKPLPGTQVRIARDGEVQVRGPGVFAGYWRNEAATAATFEDGWYQTGDLGYLDDGYLYLRGRKKDLIVLSDGQNVYPEDIELVLGNQPGITEAVVVGLPKDGLVRLHAVLLESIPGSAAEAVREANRELDSRQQVLSFSTWAGEDFPRTHTLKVRRNVVLEALAGQEPQAVASPAAVEGDPLLRLVAQCAGAERVDAIREDAELAGDLGLDSLGRVELLSAIEEELGAFIDDADVLPSTTLAELRQMVSRTERRRKAPNFPTWPRSWPARQVRRMLMAGFVLPGLRPLYSLQVRGRANLVGLQEPCLIISNHNMHLDQAMLLRAMPHGFRQRVAIAAAASDIFGNRFRGFWASLLGNAFPFAKEGSGVRESLEYVARMLDGGWNVLIFPEGKLTVVGPMQRFKSGVGLLAVETGVPVLPMRIDVLRPGFYEGKWMPHPRARVRVSFGKPVRFEPGTGYAEATTILEQAVREA